MYYKIYIIYDTHMYDSHVCACTHTDTLVHIKFMYIYDTHNENQRDGSGLRALTALPGTHPQFPVVHHNHL